MTYDELLQRVLRLKLLAEKGNGPECHCLEDELREDVLKEIAQGHPDSQRLASLVLVTSNIEFDRWFE
jgi:hypothetical protein